jgi:hypothetical protein
MRQLEKSIKHRIPSKAKKTNIAGAFTIARPSKELNIKAAGLRTLLRYGLFVKRPPPGADPKLIVDWNKTINEILQAQNFVDPYLEPQLGVTHQLKNLKQTDSGYTSLNWSGAALVGNWSGVVGRWTIPTVSKPPAGPPGPDGTWTSASWVGLDGLTGHIPGGNSADVLQGGVTQWVDLLGQATYVPWFEWYVPPDQPDGSYSPNLMNQFPYICETAIGIQVNAGDSVGVVVQYVKNKGDLIGNVLPPPGPYGFGGVSFANLTTSQYSSVWLLPPPGASFSGDSAEWIMELPGGLGTLPAFTDINFDLAGACNSDPNTQSNLQEGDPITLGIPFLQFISPDATIPNTAENITGETTLTISYVQPGI